MCGRFVLSTPADAIAAEFAALTGGIVLSPRYNIAPMQDVVVVRSLDGARTLSMLRWGLIPSWAKDPAIAARLINARAESAATKPSFREAMKARRCIVPASGFYEWREEGKQRQPWYFRPSRPGALLAIAGLWERWRSPSGEVVESLCLLTTDANPLVTRVHDRMPVILDREGVERWLDPAEKEPATLTELLVPAPEEQLSGHPVSQNVNAVRNDDARNVEAIDATGAMEKTDAVDTAAKGDPRQGTLPFGD